MKLNSIMEFEHVIQICEDGSLVEVDTIYAPDVYVSTDEDGQIVYGGEQGMISGVEEQGWTLLSGWTGQYGDNGPIMHPSEFVGGALERHILETPGFYVVCVVETDDGPAGWAIAYRETV